jgi:hypothetical protein
VGTWSLGQSIQAALEGRGKMNDDAPKKKPVYRGSLFFPVLLLVIGIVFLLNNLGKLSESAWDTFLLCWPFIFIIMGLDSFLHRHGAAVPTFFISLGVILLLSNFDQIAWNSWDILLVIWPVFLVAVGLDILFGRRSFWMGLLAGIMVLSLFFGILWYFESDLMTGHVAVDNVEQTISGANQAEILIQPIVSYLAITDLKDSNNLVQGKINHLQGENIHQSYQVQDGQGMFTLESSGESIIFPVVPGSEPSWDLGLTPKIPIDLAVKQVMGQTKIDAQAMNLSGLSTSIVIGETSIYLPEEGVLAAKIEGVMGIIAIYVPSSMEVKINSDVSLQNIQLPDNFVRSGDYFYSPGYSNAENRVDINVSQVLGIVKVVEK